MRNERNGAEFITGKPAAGAGGIALVQRRALAKIFSENMHFFVAWRRRFCILLLRVYSPAAPRTDIAQGGRE